MEQIVDTDRTGIVVWSHYRERSCLKKKKPNNIIYTKLVSFMVKYLTILHTEMYIA